MSETSATPLSRKLILAAYGWAPSTARGDRLATGAAAAAPRLEACAGAAAAVVAGELSGEWSHASEALRCWPRWMLLLLLPPPQRHCQQHRPALGLEQQ